MADSWIDTTIGDQATLQRGIDITKAEQREGDVPVVSSSGVSSYHDTAAVSGPGVVLGRKGVIGSVYYIDRDYWPHDTTLWVKDFHGNEPRFVYYFFKHIARRIAGMDVGSANPTLNRNHVHPIEIRWPHVPEQRAIAYILGTLDDKIELNRKMNKTLEAIERTIFKSWFIDFDPVRAKAEGYQPLGMDAKTTALFPNSFEDSELGMIPKGWKHATIENVCERILDKVDKSSEWASEVLIDLKRMPRKSIALTNWGKGEELTTSITRFRAKDILFGAIRPYFHKVGIAPVDGVTNVSLFVLRANCSTEWSYVAALCSFPSTVEYAIQVSKGTKMPVVAWHDLRAYEIVLPPSKVRKAFCERVNPLYLQIINNILQSRTLAVIRDALIPKILSGEIRIKNVEKLAEHIA